MVSPTTKLIIRADASDQLGYGHVLRCLSLAQVWKQEGGEVLFVTADMPPSIANRLKKEAMGVIAMEKLPGSNADARATAEISNREGVSWVVLDGYHFTGAYQKIIKNSGCRLLCIDDYGHAEHYYADLIVNQNLHATATAYNAQEPATQLLLGIEYALLRQEFHAHLNSSRQIPPVARKILVTLGGSDTSVLLQTILAAFRTVPVENLEISVAGGKCKNVSPNDTRFSLSPGSTLQFFHDAENMAELMAWADLCITAAGSTAWELSYMGLPSLLIAIADNQKPIGAHLNTVGAARYLGWHQTLTVERLEKEISRLLLSPKERRSLSHNGQKIMDGKGVYRVIDKLSCERLHIRAAEKKDCKKIWEWANSPSIRTASFSSEKIPWDHHRDWYHKQLCDRMCNFYVAENHQGIAVGQIRFNTDGPDALVSISIDPKYHNRGYGRDLLAIASDRMLTIQGVKQLHARIKKSNRASLRMFQKVGYTNLGMEEIDGNPAYHLIFRKQ